MHPDSAVRLSLPRLPSPVVVLAILAGSVRLSRWYHERTRSRTEELEHRTASLADANQQALRTRDEFLSTLSHELRTPLNAMPGWVQLLKMHRHTPALRDHAIDVIEQNARTQVQLVADLLDLSRLVTGRLQLIFKRVAGRLRIHGRRSAGPSQLLEG